MSILEKIINKPELYTIDGISTDSGLIVLEITHVKFRKLSYFLQMHVEGNPDWYSIKN